jgi:cell division septum initiation protein DivIVA
MNKYSEEEVQQLVELVGKLLEANEELNARVIAIDAYLKNEMSRTKQLKQIIREYEARINYNSSN